MFSIVLRQALALAVVYLLSAVTAAEAQTRTITITNNGPNSGAVGVRAGNTGNVCNPFGFDGGTCVFTYPAGTPLRLMANSPSTPGIFNGGTGDAGDCATSVCEFTLNQDSSIFATFDADGGPYPSLTINLIDSTGGNGKGNVGTDNNQCQNFELGFSACTTYYGAGSAVVMQGRNMPGNIFGGFSGGTVDAAGCTGTANCSFTLTADSSVNASFSALRSVAVAPSARTINVSSNTSFSAVAAFTNGMSRNGSGGSTLWQSHVPMDHPRFSLAAAVVNNLLYAFGGVNGSCAPGPGCPFAPMSTVEAFDPTKSLMNQFDEAWTSRPSMSFARESLAGVAVNGEIYAIGGHTSGGGSVSSMESWVPGADSWTTRPSMSAPRARMAAAAIDNTIYVVGGADDAAPVATVEAYDTVTGLWSVKAPLPSPRDLPSAAAVNGILYVHAGAGTGSFEAFDPAAGPLGTWSTRAPMPNGGGSHKMVALNGLIYAIGGSSGTMKVYNPATNSWLTLGNMPSFQGQFALAVLDGRLFAAGGNDAGNTAIATVTANRPPEATWWSSNNAVGRINAGNNGNVQGLSPGTSTISVRLVNVDSGAQSALLTVNAPTIFVNVPNQVSTEVGEANWGCGTFNHNTSGPWAVTVDYGDGGGPQSLPFQVNPPPGTCFSPNSKGAFFFNHAYAAPGTYRVKVTVQYPDTNPTTSTTREFDVEVEAPACVPIQSTINVIGTVPFDRVHVAVFDRVTGALLTDPDTALPLGVFNEAALPAGQYRFEFSVPAGYIVTPSTLLFDAVCGEPMIINLTVQAAPPTLTVALSPNVLWPPNNKMANIEATITSDGAGVELVSITSSEPGDDDIAGASMGTDDRSFQLRAQRNGGGSGRTYTITYRATSTLGATTTVTATVFVPHDQGK